MHKESIILLEKNLYKTVFKYVSLSVISMLGLSLYILADTFFVARGVGNNGLVALNLALPVYSFINGIGLLLGMGGATRFSIAIGEGRQEKCTNIFMQVLYSAIVIGLCITLVGVFFSQDIVRLLGASNDIVPLANAYLKTIMCFSCAFIINNIFVCFVRNDGNPNLAMIAMLTASISNIILDYIFVFPLQMGMFGAALATGLAPLLSLCVLSFHFIKKQNSFKIKKCTLLKTEIKPIFFAGIPSFITELSSGIIILLFNGVILSITGNIGVAAYGIISNIALVCVAIFTGIGQGIQPLISLNYGAGKTKNILRILLCGCGTALVFGLLFYSLGLFFSQDIIAVFNKDQDVVLNQIADEGIHLYFSAFIIMGINLIAISFFACVAKANEAFFISIFRGLVAILPILFILSHFMGLKGVWLTVPLSELFTVLVSIPCMILYFKETVKSM